MKKNFKSSLPEIAGRLKQVRNTLDISVDRIAAETGLAKSTVSDAENGNKKPSVVYLFGLLDLYRVNINYVLTGEGEVFLETPGEMKEGDEFKELLYMMENVSLVKYSVLSYYIDFKTRNKDVIDELLKETLKKKLQ
jgi:transcriptional regulator with XRE-family HTH domain